MSKSKRFQFPAHRHQRRRKRWASRKGRLVIPCLFGVVVIIGLVLTIVGQFLGVVLLSSTFDDERTTSSNSSSDDRGAVAQSFLQLRRRQNHDRKHPVAPISYRRRQLSSKTRPFLLPAYPMNHRRNHQNELRVLSNKAITACNHALWRTLETTTLVLPNNETFVFTGDIYDLWLRDSAAQIHPLLLPRTYKNGNDYGSLVQSDPRLERIVSGLILKTARYIRYDPYANAFRQKDDHEFNTFERDVLGRFGFISTWNYELDSGCYFIRMVYYFYCSFPSHPIFLEKEVKEAVMIMLDVWIAEQRHEDGKAFILQVDSSLILFRLNLVAIFNRPISRRAFV
jgi:hypothetical protein